jgi:hypothetical protein
MKSKHPFVHFLRICCLVAEAVAALRLLAILAILPFSDALVRSGHASVGLYPRNGSIDWTFSAHLPFGGRDSFIVDGPGIPPDPRLGKVSLGPFRLHLADAEDAPGRSAVVEKAEGVVTLVHPDEAAHAAASAKWPFAISAFCTGAVGLALLELFRRMLRSVERHEVFAASNIRDVRTIGILLVGSSILKAFTAAWLAMRMAAIVTPYLAGGKVTLESSSNGGLPGLATGLMILVLAEVFRQGLTLKEESDLTI